MLFNATFNNISVISWHWTNDSKKKFFYNRYKKIYSYLEKDQLKFQSMFVSGAN